MVNSLSPELNVSETESFQTIPSVSFSTGVVVGTFAWGPVLETILVSDEKDLTRRYSKPVTGFNVETWHTAADFLKYSNALFIVNINDGEEAVPNLEPLGSFGEYIISSDEYSTDSSNGINAKFKVQKEDGYYNMPVITDGGEQYSLGDIFSVPGSLLGGLNGINDLTITVSAISSTGGITGVSFSGLSENNNYTTSDLKTISAKYPGEMGNSISLSICDSNCFNTYSYRTFFGKAPDPNCVHITVIDSDGSFTGSSGSVLQLFENLSLVPGSKLDDGTNNFILDVLNLESLYFKFDADPKDWLERLIQYFVSEGYQFDIAFEGGTNGLNEPSLPYSRYIEGFDLLSSTTDIIFSFILMGKVVDSVLPNYVVENICEKRKDCLAFISPPKEITVENPIDQAEKIVEFRNSLSSSSYGVLDSGYKYIYDKYNDKYEWIPLNSDIAGLCARTDYPWISPAGYEKGMLKNVIKVSYNPDKSDRDLLYVNGINSVIMQPGIGTLLFGDKTLLRRSSAFDRINVRRLFIAMNVGISVFSRYTLFEFNNEYNRTRFTNIVNDFLRKIESRDGIFTYKIVCDETNNTPSVIDRNSFVADIYVKPSRSINFIKLNLTSLNSDIEVQEYVTRFE